MDGSRETQEASKYLKRHVEPSQPEKPINPILKNPDSKSLDGFLEADRTTTPFFAFSGTLAPISTGEFIDSVVERQRRQLESEGKTDIGAEGTLTGTRIGLGMRLEGDGKYSAQTVNSLIVEGDGTNIDIRSLLPDQYQVVWVPGGSIDRSAHDLRNELLIISGDITSPEGLLVTLHEIGHYEDLKNDPARKAALLEIQGNMMAPKPEELEGVDPEFVKAFLAKFKPVTDNDVGTFIESERNAWAFALRTMSRITNNNTLMQACREYIHEQPLRIQADILRSRDFIK